MGAKDFTCSITVNVTAAEAFEAITQVSEWWAKHVEGNPHDAGSIFTVRFGETFGVFEIIEVVPGKKIVWLVKDCYLPIFKNITEWTGTKIAWNISTLNDATCIQFTHVGLVPGLECYNDCTGGWSFYVKESLYKLITTGKGLPGTGIRATIANGDRVYKGTLFFKNDPLPDFEGEYILIDVKEIQGEHVVSAIAVERLNKATFSAQQICGKHYMLVEDKPVFEGVDMLQDLLATVVK